MNVGTALSGTETLALNVPEVKVKVADPLLGDDGATTGNVKVPFVLSMPGDADPPELNPGGYVGEPGKTKAPGALMVMETETELVVPMKMLTGETGAIVNGSWKVMLTFTV